MSDKANQAEDRGIGGLKARAVAFYAYMKMVFRSLSLRTQLLLILFVLLLISIGSLTIIYTRAEEALLDKVGDNIDDITKAIQISVEELTYRGDSTARLKSYVDMLNKKGIKEISIVSDKSEVIASSDPMKIGTTTKITEKKSASRKKDLMITARLGDEHRSDTQRLYNIIMPVSIKGQNIGYIHINMALDDYRLLQNRNQIKRILSMIFAFTIGIIVCLVIAEKYTEPIKRIATASRKIAMGELVRIGPTDRKDEIGTLVTSFNEMVDKLSEQKELEEKLKKSEQLSLIGQLSSGIAHEIRNPLNFLTLSIGHLKERISEEKISDKEELAELLDNLVKEVYRINELIHNFLFLGKTIALHREHISPGDLINEALVTIKDKVRSGIEVKTSCDEAGEIFCDREYIRLSLINLIVNAIQSINDSGQVRIECSDQDGMTCMSVSDTGHGIAEDELDRIFEPYYSTKKLGIGLGLAITKRFVEEHGGTISALSQVGKGTTMMIRLPHHEG
ncbi:MAG: HAMP domain-containing sensor histidine kinase [Syntrophorhabdaceae bacterium]|nr:HAMP domain-containing histidine kinase [Syntrophorhabdaceae bacterium]MDD4196298.1 HAMP domain-containing sensor histidine kinase [Syntrophorhabdaceae bacterium]HOC45521.1 HAMP domain-containing sensor histidine kinase [Syntrophorhabdaceae bacterium]